MERDLHEKQDTLIVLRQQLADVKAINLQLFKKSQDSEATLKHKNELVPRYNSRVGGGRSVGARPRVKRWPNGQWGSFQ
jgi:hypothetical protein